MALLLIAYSVPRSLWLSRVLPPLVALPLVQSILCLCRCFTMCEYVDSNELLPLTFTAGILSFYTIHYLYSVVVFCFLNVYFFLLLIFKNQDYSFMKKSIIEYSGHPKGKWHMGRPKRRWKYKLNGT